MSRPAIWRHAAIAVHQRADGRQAVGATLGVTRPPGEVVDDEHVVATPREVHRGRPTEVPVTTQDQDSHVSPRLVRSATDSRPRPAHHSMRAWGRRLSGRSAGSGNGAVRRGHAASHRPGEQNAHRDRRRNRAGEEPELDAQQQVVAQERHDDEHGQPGSPPDRDPGLLAQSDQRLGQREPEEVDAGRRGEQGEVTTAEREVRTERDADDRRARGAPRRAWRPRRARRPPRSCGASRSGGRGPGPRPRDRRARGSSAACTPWKRKTGMRAMIEAREELTGRGVVLLRPEELHEDRTGVDECLREDRAREQPAERRASARATARVVRA